MPDQIALPIEKHLAAKLARLLEDTGGELAKLVPVIDHRLAGKWNQERANSALAEYDKLCDAARRVVRLMHPDDAIIYGGVENGGGTESVTFFTNDTDDPNGAHRYIEIPTEMLDATDEYVQWYAEEQRQIKARVERERLAREASQRHERERIVLTEAIREAVKSNPNIDLGLILHQAGVENFGAIQKEQRR